LPYALVVDSHRVTRAINTPDQAQIDHPQTLYQRDIFQHLLCPFFVKYQYAVLQYKLNKRDWRQIPKPPVPGLPASVPEKWKPTITGYAKLFEVFRNYRGTLVSGDTGVSSLFACAPYNCIDVTTYLGGSLPLAIGAGLGGIQNVWAVTGDFAFIGAGHLGLLEARLRNFPLKVVILDNGKAETTGGQIIPDNTLETILSGYRKNCLVIMNPQDRDEIESVLKQAAQSPDMCIVVAQYRS
jgi:hypothetical protein